MKVFFIKAFVFKNITHETAYLFFTKTFAFRNIYDYLQFYSLVSKNDYFHLPQLVFLKYIILQHLQNFCKIIVAF